MSLRFSSKRRGTITTLAYYMLCKNQLLKSLAMKEQKFLFVFVLIVVYLGKQFFSHAEMEPPIPGYYQYFWGVNVSCSRKEHTDPPRIEPGSPDRESYALTTRPVRLPRTKMVNKRLAKYLPSQYNNGNQVYIKVFGKDERLKRGGKSIKAPRVFEFICECDPSNYRYKVELTNHTGKKTKEWIKVNDITSRSYEKEKQKKAKAKKKAYSSSNKSCRMTA